MSTAILLLSAAWLLFIGCLMKINGGPVMGTLIYKAVPIALSFGLTILAVQPFLKG